MKNMAVGKKMMLGFGAVILMIVLILAMSTVTSVTRNSDLTRSLEMSDLQREANLMLDNFNLARVEIRSLFTSIDAKEEHDAALEYLAVSSGHLDKMEALSKQLDNYMFEEIQTLRGMFQTVESAITTVGNNDEKANETIAVMMENGTHMSESTTKMADLVVRVILDIGNTDTERALERVENVILPVLSLNNHVDELRIESRNLMLQQDTSVIPILNEGLDELVQEGTNIRAILSTDEARAAVDTMLSSVEGFRASIGDVEKILAASESEIAAARQTFGELSLLVDGFVSTISDEVHSMNSSVVSMSRATMLLIVIVGLIASVFSVFVAIYLSKAITRPLTKMKAVMEQAGGTGNLNFSEETKEDILGESQAKDELGQSLLAFTRFVDQITYVAGCLQSVAARDLSINVRLLSDEDTMGIALRDMLDNLNEIFAEINNISRQVAASSHEVAIGAQTLAQGSTEQAATVQEISASVAEINEQMNLSNETADNTAVHGREIGGIAADGNEKMALMIGSMTEINDASQAIGRVIKVIDDIAFQTNILALNAAVEAARAGQHGKGFAVVSDEVRNLSAKSADAAKETAELISTNIAKTEQGLAFTQETAESLTRIIAGIEQTNESLKQIAEQSQSTKTATTQVNAAIDQVSMVIQQNSATSEESAAASQEMSSQAQVLQEYIARFRLRGEGAPVTPDRIDPAPGAADMADNGMSLHYAGGEKY